MPSGFPNKIFLFPLIAVSTLMIGFFLLIKFSPAIPLSIVTTTKTDFFTVVGEGKASAAPDVAQISLGITVNGNSIGSVQSQANGIINNVSSAVKRLGVGDKDIQTTSYNLRPDYDYNNGKQSIRGYIADINLVVKARQFDKVNQIIDSATANGANQVGGLSFTLDDATREKLESQARKIAIAKAKQKATQIATESGINLGRIVNVTEGTNSGPRPIYAMEKSIPVTGGGNPTQIEPGSSEISISVTLSYETR